MGFLYDKVSEIAYAMYDKGIVSYLGTAAAAVISLEAPW